MFFIETNIKGNKWLIYCLYKPNRIFVSNHIAKGINTSSKKYKKNLLMGDFNHSHKKRNNSLEGSLDRVLFPAELDFPKILVPRLPQHTSNVNIECAEKLKQLYFLYVISFYFRSITIPELNTGRIYCCSYYSRQSDRWQYEKAN